MFMSEIRHFSLECLWLPGCLLLEALLHRSSHSPYSTALLSETRRAAAREARSVGDSSWAGLQESLEERIGSCVKAACILPGNLQR